MASNNNGLHQGEAVVIHGAVSQRVPMESVPFQRVIEETEAHPVSLRHLCIEYSFEELMTYTMQAEDNWSEMINTHVKIALDPKIVYRIRDSVTIDRNCYIMGNGANVQIEMSEGSAFIVRKDRFNPIIRNMSGVTFQNVKFFAGDCTRTETVVFQVTKKTYFNNCLFFGFTYTCILSYDQIVCRSCIFESCFRCVCLYHNDSPYFSPSKVSHCVFKRCVLGVNSRAFIRVKNNVAYETYCLALLYAGGFFGYNKILTPWNVETVNVKYCTCRDGIILPLHTVHFGGNTKARWPVIKNNVFTKCSIFVGFRRGTTMFRNCCFYQTSMYVEPEVGNKISFSGVYGLDLAVYKMLRYTSDFVETQNCECGAVHRHTRVMFGEITSEVLPNPRLMSCQSAEYSSDSGLLIIN
ncbi:large T-antigen [Bat mastadenovirus WIV13]|uniref:E1B 55 kDa protein n=1 Tax=Bat mastadenovirus WIV13 TaxID=1788435 RepID=A0A1B0UHV3_9ADEN|nr:large T-antigen [Bat mastadenovirus WIV13]AMB43019.1 large T-antigen [Bat mastadenovirus WIV13]